MHWTVTLLQVIFCICLQNAVMSFEEEKVSHSMDTLRNMERRCGGGGADGGNGWFSSVKNIVMGSLSASSHDQVWLLQGSCTSQYSLIFIFYCI